MFLFGVIGFLRSGWHILVMLPLRPQKPSFLLKGRKIVAWLGWYGTGFAAAAGLRFAGLASLNVLAFGLILLFPLLGQLQLTLKLLDALTFRCFLGGRSRGLTGVAGLVLTQELTIQTGIAVSSSALPFLLQALLGIILFSGTFLFFQLPLALFFVPASALLFHLTALFLP
jgi:hypothetical protein